MPRLSTTFVRVWALGVDGAWFMSGAEPDPWQRESVLDLLWQHYLHLLLLGTWLASICSYRTELSSLPLLHVFVGGRDTHMSDEAQGRYSVHGRLRAQGCSAGAWTGELEGEWHGQHGLRGVWLTPHVAVCHCAGP